MERIHFLESPNYRDNYPPDANCLWKIIPSQGVFVSRRIFLEFSDFDIEYPSEPFVYDYDDDDSKIISNNKTSKCTFDSLVIEERDMGDTKNLIRSHEYCGSSMPDKMNTSNAVFIMFVKLFIHEKWQMTDFSFDVQSTDSNQITLKLVADSI